MESGGRRADRRALRFPQEGPSMSRDDWEWHSSYPPSAPKLPPPKHGIKVKKFGTTWWGRRWIEALEHLGAEYAARLKRGQSYARQGRVHDLEIEGGTITARVTGTRLSPYHVTIRVAPLADRVWRAAIKTMAGRALFAARLLAGEMPQGIDDAFLATGASLFPQRAGDLSTECTCPDWANPCKHVAALHYVLADAFDRDPFLLFELRGRPKDLVLPALRRIRAAATPSTGRAKPDAGKPARGAARSKRDAAGSGRDAAGSRQTSMEVGTDAAVVTLKGVTPDQYELFRGPIDALRFHIGTPATSGAILRQLGSPPSWSLRASPVELLYPVVARAAARARKLALGSPHHKEQPPTGGPEDLKSA
jgi:uncharacterized Zn finger protein